MIFKTTEKPRKWYRGKKRICRKYCFWGDRPNHLRWLLSIKVGDYLGSCSGFNIQIAQIEYHWGPAYARSDGRALKQIVLDDILLVDTAGRYHYASGSGCIGQTYSTKEILKGLQEWYTEENVQRGWLSPEQFKSMRYKLDHNLPIVDERGVLLPEKSVQGS